MKKLLSFRAFESLRTALNNISESEERTATDLIRQFIRNESERILKAPAETKESSVYINARITPEEKELLDAARKHSGKTLSEFFEPLLVSARYGYVHDSAIEKLPFDSEKDCCENEERNYNGWCKNCGDPGF